MCGLTGFWQQGGCSHDEAVTIVRRMTDKFTAVRTMQGNGSMRQALHWIASSFNPLPSAQARWGS